MIFKNNNSFVNNTHTTPNLRKKDLGVFMDKDIVFISLRNGKTIPHLHALKEVVPLPIKDRYINLRTLRNRFDSSNH